MSHKCHLPLWAVTQFSVFFLEYYARTSGRIATKIAAAPLLPGFRWRDRQGDQC